MNKSSGEKLQPSTTETANLTVCYFLFFLVLTNQGSYDEMNTTLIINSIYRKIMLAGYLSKPNAFGDSVLARFIS